MIKLGAQLLSILVLTASSLALMTLAARRWHAELPALVVPGAPGNGELLTKSAAAPLDAFQPVALEAYDQTLQRPIFIAGRRPPEAKPMVAPLPLAPPMPPTPVVQQINLDRYRMLGVLVIGANRKVLVETPDGGRRWFAIGDVLGEWQVGKIFSDRMELNGRGRAGELRLYPMIGQK